jgi:hypothetical protein
MLQLFKGTLDNHISLIEQDQTARNRLRAVQIVSHDDRCHVVFLLEFENQIIDLPSTDGIEAGRGLVEQQDVRFQSKRTCQPYSLLHAAGDIRGHLRKLAFHSHFRQ